MTPPLKPVQGPKAPPPPSSYSPKSNPADSAQPISGGKSSYVALDSGDGAAFKTKSDLVAALSNERLFGSALKDFEANKDKYLRVSLALDSIRSALSGDGKSAIAVQRITMWLSDPTLLQDKAVAHVARVNLVKALKLAPKDPAIDESVKAILEALQKNYAPAQKPETAPTTQPTEAPKTLSAQLEDAALFGDKFKDYDAKRNSDYASVTLALVEIRKLATGKTKDADAVKLRIERWLGNATLLTNKVPHQARVSLIKVLGAAPASAANDTLIAALKADYSKSAPKPEAPAEVPSEVKVKVEKGVSTYQTKPNAKLKSSREDTAQTFQQGMNPAVKWIYERFLKSSPNGISAEMTVTVSEKTGAITDVSFTNVKSQAGDDSLKSFFNEVANALRGKFLFKSGTFDSGDFGFIKANLKFVPQ